MTGIPLIPQNESVEAIRLHCAEVGQAWIHLKPALILHDSSDLVALQANRTYGRHVKFFLTLPHEHPVDIILINAAVSHVHQMIEGLGTWDEGKLIRTTWPDKRYSVIGQHLVAEDIASWTRQPIYTDGKACPPPRRGQSSKLRLQAAADRYLDEVLRHVVDVRFD